MAKTAKKAKRPAKAVARNRGTVANLVGQSTARELALSWAISINAGRGDARSVLHDAKLLEDYLNGRGRA